MNFSRKKLFLFLSLVWMICIFCFSARNAVRSTEDSLKAGKLVGRIIYRDFARWSEPKKEAFAIRIDHPVRKTAHALEYALLAVLLLGTFLPERPGSTGITASGRTAPAREEAGPAPPGGFPGSGLRAFLGCFLYACTDEIHQLFVPGRSGQFTDVLIDCAGALLGLLLSAVCLHLYRRLFLKGT